MPALNFRKNFVPLIENGKKRQTIRPCRKDGRNPKPGQVLYLYTGMRTKGCRKIGEVLCRSVDPVTIEELHIFIGCKQLDIDEKYDLAVADGFNYIDDFRSFFQTHHGLPFSGYLIKW